VHRQLNRAGIRRGMAALAAATAALLLTGMLTAPAGADTPSRVALPDPNLGPAPSGGTASPASPQLTMALRVYLSGPNPQAEAAAALAVSDPRGPSYARYLTPDRYQQVFGPSAAQVSTVSSWLTAEGMTITATNQHYITVTATVAQVDAALDTQITAYAHTNPTTGKTITTYADVGGFSVPAALGNDITTITGFAQWAQLNGNGGIILSTAHISTTQGATIAVVLDGYSPTMLADANQFFVGQGVPGFAPGQYTEDFGGDDESASALGASCDNEPDQPEEALDVETAHIAAPDAHVVYMGTDCTGDGEQNFLDTMTSIVDRHLAEWSPTPTASPSRNSRRRMSRPGA